VLLVAKWRPARIRMKTLQMTLIAFAEMERYPKFHNEVGVSIVRIGCREFECIGDRPPQDHPHIYLNMGDTGEIICPYCSTLFRFDPSLNGHEAEPADCVYDDVE
jgi:uncharacterized Zn-finger protein